MKTPDNGLLVYVPHIIVVDCITAHMLVNKLPGRPRIDMLEASEKIQKLVGEKLMACIMREVFNLSKS